MDAKTELQSLKNKLEAKIRALQLELETVDKAMNLLAREHSKPEETSPRTKAAFSRMTVTDAIRSLIGDEFITPLQIRDALTDGGFVYPNGASRLLNVVWATTQRFGDNKAYEIGKAKDGKMAIRRKPLGGGGPMLPLAEGAQLSVEKLQ